jgi:hypothetical protein
MRLKKPSFTDKRKKPIVKKSVQPKLKFPRLMSSGIRTGLGATPSFSPTGDTSMDTSGDMSSAPSSGESSGEGSYKKGGIVHRGQGAVMKIKTTKYC